MPEQELASPVTVPVTESASKTEYDRLNNYFDRIFTKTMFFIGAIVTATGIFLWRSVDDVKSQAAQSIAAISKTAEITATAEAQKAIDAAFDKQNVQQMIERAAKTKVDTAVQAEIDKTLGAKIDAFNTKVEATTAKVDGYKGLLTEIAEIGNHSAELRLGYRAGLDYLLQKRQSSDPTVSAYAAATLKEIAADYDRQEVLFLGNRYNDPDAFLIANVASTPKQLMSLIRNPGPEMANYGALRTERAFFDMKKRVHWDVQTFDIPAAEKWCAAHKPTCDQ